MAANPYTVLGLERSATDADIRQAFRGLAKTLHPDVNPGDDAAVDRFKTVSAAYEILGDADKRRAFDRGEIDANGEPVRGFASAGGAGFGGFGGARGRAGPGMGGGFGGGGFGDAIDEIFGAHHQRGPMRGQDVRYTLEIDFLEAIAGAKKRVTMPEGGTLDLNVPAGVAQAQVLRLRGKGNPGLNGGPAGNANVEIKIRPHPDFERDGQNIRSRLAVPLEDAILGGKIEVQTASGRVSLTLPEGTSSGRTFRLKGKGVPKMGGGDAGDHLVTIDIAMPAEIDDDLRAFFERRRDGET